jgi:hypothetical protein
MHFKTYHSKTYDEELSYANRIGEHYVRERERVRCECSSCNCSGHRLTSDGEVWSVIDKDTGQQVGTVTGTNGEQTYKIKFRRSRGEPVRSGGGGG